MFFFINFSLAKVLKKKADFQDTDTLSGTNKGIAIVKDASKALEQGVKQADENSFEHEKDAKISTL